MSMTIFGISVGVLAKLAYPTVKVHIDEWIRDWRQSRGDKKSTDDSTETPQHQKKRNATRLKVVLTCATLIMSGVCMGLDLKPLMKIKDLYYDAQRWVVAKVQNYEYKPNPRSARTWQRRIGKWFRQRTCLQCDGRGELVCIRCDGFGIVATGFDVSGRPWSYADCPGCAGNQYQKLPSRIQCPDCNGSGLR